jgi:shikimate dehydrogenase
LTELITGETMSIAHFGNPPKSFKAPTIYNPYFESIGVNAFVVPMGGKAENYPEVARATFKLTNIGGARVTMPHKGRSVCGRVDRRRMQCDPAARRRSARPQLV